MQMVQTTVITGKKPFQNCKLVSVAKRTRHTKYAIQATSSRDVPVCYLCLFLVQMTFGSGFPSTWHFNVRSDWSWSTLITLRCTWAVLSSPALHIQQHSLNKTDSACNACIAYAHTVQTSVAKRCWSKLSRLWSKYVIHESDQWTCTCNRMSAAVWPTKWEIFE